MLARLGVVGVTDTSAHNNQQSRQEFERLGREGDLLQRFNVMGDDSLDSGYLKILLTEISFRRWMTSCGG